MTEQDMAILVLTLFYFLNPNATVPSQAEVIKTIRAMKAKDAVW